MIDEESRPLLGDNPNVPSSLSIGKRPSSHSDMQPNNLQSQSPFQISSESTPLLHRRDDGLVRYSSTESRRSASPASSNNSLLKRARRGIPWTLFCILLAIGSIVTILILAFFVPEVVKDYAKEAAVFQPTSLSIESATADGIKARIQGDISLDASRVHRQSVRDLGRFITWIGREIETGQSEVEVYLPEYNNILVGTASVPSMVLGIRNGHVNHVDFEAELIANDMDGIRSVALAWVEGKLDHLQILGRATLHLKSGLLRLGEQTLSDYVTFEGGAFPSLPQARVTGFQVHDANAPVSNGPIAVDVSLDALVDSPFDLQVPPLGFEVLVPNCSPRNPHILVADVATKEFPIHPGKIAALEVSGIIHDLSDELTTACPGKKRSPLDSLIKNFIQGLETTVYVRGAEVPSLGTPQWIIDILKSVTVPLSFTGNPLDNLVKNLTMSDVHFSLPNPMAEPDAPESNPTISALVKVLIGLPKGMNFHIDVPQVRANADVFYRKRKLGVLRVEEWQPAKSTPLGEIDNSPSLLVEFPMKEAPLEVSDDDVLTDVLQNLIFNRRPVQLHVVANVDTEVSTSLGEFTIHEIPAEGEVTVKPPYGGF